MKYITAILLTVFLVGCSQIPNEAYVNSAGPERLLDVSSERVNVSLANANSMDQLIEWLNEDQPSRAELYCPSQNDLCIRAEEILDQFAVPYDIYTDNYSQVALVYDRVVARDCFEGMGVNHHNPYNLPYPGFGCALAANSLQMIANKQQIVSPALTDYQDADRAVTTLGIYSKPDDKVLEFDNLFDD